MKLLRRYALTLGCLVTVAGSAAAKAPAEFSGIPKILDGDTVQFGTIKLHMEGMDAPQIDQLCFDRSGGRWKCGVTARERLKSHAGSKAWVCKMTRRDGFGRKLANCQIDGKDIAREMVEEGWALASTTGSAKYLANEETARTSAAGLWAGAFVAPMDWRQHNWHAKILGNAVPQAGNSSAQLLTSAFGEVSPSEECAIKGNVNWSGKCIFHKPGGHWYKRITMEARYGDRWFCSATEAIASGCRETRR
jgi:endonuclease YncB( thermonuclease family)